jgi:hypothetical protein
MLGTRPPFLFAKEEDGLLVLSKKTPKKKTPSKWRSERVTQRKMLADVLFESVFGMSL